MILVTGATGYLGRHVAARLKARRVVYVGTRGRTHGDLADGQFVRALVFHVAPTVVIHCAAVVPKGALDYNNEAAAIQSLRMLEHVVDHVPGAIVFSSSMAVCASPRSAYADGKHAAEAYCRRRRDCVVMRLPGLFGLPRRSGVIYEAAKSGQIPDSFGPHPAMHVKDAAEYLVRAAMMPSDGNSEPFDVTYGNPRLEACYGSLGVTFDQRVQAFVHELKRKNERPDYR